MRRSWSWLPMLVLAACGGSTPVTMPEDGAPAIDAPPHIDGDPGTGAHALAYFRIESHAESLATAAMSTRAAGSTILVSVGRGNASAFAAPTDNKGNPPYGQLGATHPYTNWPSSGTALYAGSNLTGGDGHIVSTTTPYDDELTMAAVEVFDATAVVDQQWREVLAPAPLRSGSVTTTGPAVLVAFWWGDAGAEGDKTATPDSGFTRVDAILDAGSLVQCAVAVREVADAGTYDVTWTATPVQGAQLWLVAVQ